jgi:hypothetical protein
MSVLDDLLFDVGKIAEVQRDELLSTAGEFLNIEKYTPFSCVTRTIKGDSREKALKRMGRLIGSLIEFYMYISESRHLTLYDEIREEINLEEASVYNDRVEKMKGIHKTLASAIHGMQNFAITYHEDSDVVAQTKKLISQIQTHLDFSHEFLRDLMNKRERVESEIMNLP